MPNTDRKGQLVAASTYTGTVHAAPLDTRSTQPGLAPWKAVCPVETNLTRTTKPVTCRRCLIWLAKRGRKIGYIIELKEHRLGGETENSGFSGGSPCGARDRNGPGAAVRVVTCGDVIPETAQR
ncbi:hypothetical protein ACWEU6_34915 [Streptosporangium sandarakinum]|uniref:hypothetical protein n=1 Tax=Streptosporangium sandarakinum TaxID=1260955 RepID=UPI0036B3EAD2